MDENDRREWDRLEDEAAAAAAAFREHRLTGFVVWRGNDPSTGVGTGTEAALGNPVWWAKYDELKVAADEARAAADKWWWRHRP